MIHNYQTAYNIDNSNEVEESSREETRRGDWKEGSVKFEQQVVLT